MGRKALDEVRQAVSGYRERRLSDELASARSSLAAVQILLTVDDELSGEDDAISSDVESVLCWAMRESVTNVIRHSRARHCRIVLRRNGFTVELLVRDDGPGRAAAPVHEGNGLRGLTERVQAMGGTATTANTAGGFDVQVGIPHACLGAQK